MLFKLLVTALSVTILSTVCVAKEKLSMPKKAMFQSVPMKNATILQEGKNKLYCPTCGMTLPMFYKTNHVATHEGKTKQYCSIHCLAGQKDAKDIKVVDTKSLKFINASTAHYVVGSDKKGTMSMISKYAFATQAEADTFAKANGGKVTDFNGALEVAKKDFSPKVMEKMKAKKAMMAKKGAKVYSSKCKQGDLPKFASVGEAKAYVVENKLCEGVKGKPLQVLGLYLFTK